MTEDDIKPGAIYRGKSGRIRQTVLVERQHPMGFKRSVLSRELNMLTDGSTLKGKDVWWRLDKFADWVVEEYRRPIYI